MCVLVQRRRRRRKNRAAAYSEETTVSSVQAAVEEEREREKRAGSIAREDRTTRQTNFETRGIFEWRAGGKIFVLIMSP